jgi:DHA3 family macrolide efflux protein-like MFS transporter
MKQMKNWKKNSILFLTSQSISLIGSMLVQYAITWYITLETKSGIMMTISIISAFLPTFFISPFAGVWADRYNKKLLIILSDSLIAISTLILAILFLLGYDSIWLLFVTSAIRGVGSGIQTPAINSLLPSLVPSDKLMKISGINGSIQSLIMLICPMVSGALLSMASIEAIFFIDVITAAIAVIILLLFLQTPSQVTEVNNKKVSYFSDLSEGIKYIRSHEYIKKFFLFCSIFFLLASPVAFLTPLQVTRSFGDGVWRLTTIEITFSVGMMIGGIIMASWGGFKNRIHTMTLSCLLIGASTFALGVIPVFWIYALVMGITGFVMPFFNTPSTVLLQENVEENFMGRVFGVLGMISSIMMPLGMVVFGPLSDMVRIEWLLIVTGVLMFIEAFFLMGDKSLLKVGKAKS